MIDHARTIISQYANSPTITALIDYANQNIDPRNNIDDFYDFIWNVNTAQGFGLDIWGSIVQVGRELQIPVIYESDYFGYQTPDDDWQPFNQSPFYNRQSGANQTYILADDAYRQLILVKALCNISSVTIPSLNNILTMLFAGRGKCYVVVDSPNNLQYCFEFALEPFEKAILEQSGAVPRPAGKNIEILDSYVP